MWTWLELSEMIVLVALLLLLRKSSSCASPVLPRSLLEANVFDVIQRDTSVTQNACTGRSTLNILWSCLATTFACTWVSVHPNIPFFGKNKWAVRRWRIFLMFLALLAPEIMIMWAMKQLQGALTIKETINKYLQSQGSKSGTYESLLILVIIAPLRCSYSQFWRGEVREEMVYDARTLPPNGWFQVTIQGFRDERR